MIDLQGFRDIMREEQAQAKKHKILELRGATLEGVLAQASIELAIPVYKLSYEILQKGTSGGPLGLFGKKEWRVQVFPSHKYTKINQRGAVVTGKLVEKTEAVVEDNQDGRFGVRLSKESVVLMKVIPAHGTGVNVTLEQVQALLKRMRAVDKGDIEESLLLDILHKASGQWEVIGHFSYNPQANADIVVSIAEDDMKASITLSTTGGMGGATPTVEEMKVALQNGGVFEGISESALNDLEMNPVYRVAMVVAEGVPPQDGLNSRVQFLFQAGLSETNMKVNAKGSIDFKMLNSIQNVMKGDPVAAILPPTDGIPGRTVRGSLITAKNGEHHDIEVGANVVISDDRTQIIADADGQVVLVGDVVHVETIFMVKGDVKNHIDFLGTIVITGNVEDGYDITAQRDIHVSGSVGRSRLTAGGNIVVGNGINGDNYGDEGDGGGHSFVKAGDSLWASFIQNCKVEAKGMVIVSDGILNSNVVALKKVLCKGKRAAIVGGVVRACEEINAVVMGSNSGTITRLEVGYNPHKRDELASMLEHADELRMTFETLRLNVTNWQQNARTKPLSVDKKKRMLDMLKRISELEEEQKTVGLVIGKLQDELEHSIVDGKISASARINIGVTIVIHDVTYQVSNEFNKGQTFYEEQGMIQLKDYEEITDDITKRETPSSSQRAADKGGHSEKKDLGNKGGVTIKG
jgi:uncharacterized protein (DUF342 family)